MFVLHPDPFLTPTYRISPFTTGDISINANLQNSGFATDYCNKRFGENKWTYTVNGREAIRLALEYYRLQPNDLVTILTTSENFYISSCVTKTIETFCQWNRTLTADTKLIFVNHEFGYPHPEMEQLKATGLPIIEDCCTTFFSQDTAGKLGQYGDFSVYSFPKFFPIQIGGLLVTHTDLSVKMSQELQPEQIQYLQNAMSFQLKEEKQLLQKRQEVFNYALNQFEKLGFSLRFETSQSVVPSALLLKNNGVLPDLNALKLHLNQHGIQSSVFYGEDAFFIPCHQNLGKTDIDYFVQVMMAFKKQLTHV